MKQIEYGIQDVDNVAQVLAKEILEGSVATFVGGLGAGKTTLIKSLVRHLGSDDIVTSPTFTYFNIYRARSGLLIYHFDLYRLSSLRDFEEAGFFEYLYQPGSVALIEWPEVVRGVLRPDTCSIEINVVDGGRLRCITYQ